VAKLAFYLGRASENPTSKTQVRKQRLQGNNRPEEYNILKQWRFCGASGEAWRESREDQLGPIQRASDGLGADWLGPRQTTLGVNLSGQ
jgi:hypothetical protein